MADAQPLSGPSSAAAAQPASAWSVVCLCAQWCATCRAYQNTWADLRQQYPQVQWAWVDIEDDEDLVGEVEIDTFPTILIAHGERALFLGAQPPQAAVLLRLLQSLQTPAQPAPLAGVEAQSLWQRLQPAMARLRAV